MTKPRKLKVNTELRQWARGISFTIAMGRRQVYTLISIHMSAQREWDLGGHAIIGERHRHMRSFVQNGHCLVDRGLIVAHVWGRNKIQRKQDKKYLVRDLWQLTAAGELVIGLLKEAGIYDEVRAELEYADQERLRLA